MNDINTITLSGRLVREAELRDVGTTKKARFTIASNHSKKSGDSWVEVPGFFDCIAWKGTAEFMAKQPKGTFVVVCGVLRHDSWEGKDGKKNSRVEINCSEVKVMAAKTDSESKPESVSDSDSIPF